MSLQIGRRGKIWGMIEAVGYGTLQTLTAAKALRHIDFQAQYDPKARVNSTEKKDTPGTATLFDRRVVANLGNLTGLIRPSGTLNTLPESSFLFEAAFGTKTNVTLATTVMGVVDSELAPTSTVFSIDDATGLTVGQAVLVTVGAVKYVRWVTAIAAAVAAAPAKKITIAPALPSAPAVDAAVKTCINYSLTTDLATSIMLLHALPGFRRELRGIGLDKLQMMFDANEEPRFVVSGPAQQQLSDAAAIDVSSMGFTTVGGNPPSGLVGDLYIANTAYLFKKLGVDLTNGVVARNSEYGNDGLATEVYRDGRRTTQLTLDAFAETAATLYDLAKAGTYASLMKQTGRTEGNIVALYCPKVDWKVPDTGNGDNAVDWSFKGEAIETADGQNDEIRLAIA
jgi:hypothetical protein